jgi:tetratricopeptide (TPR) repeat protein
MEPDADNFRAALGWLLDHDPESGLGLAGALNHLWCLPHLRFEVRWIDALLERLPSPSLTARAGALVTLGSVAHSSGRNNDADRHHREALRLYREAGDDSGAAIAQLFLAYHQHIAGEHAECQRSLDETLALAERSGNVRALLGYHELSSLVAAEHGDVDSALSHIEAIQEIHRDAGGGVGGPAVPMLSPANIGWYYYLAGRLEEAGELLDQAVGECRARGAVDPAAWDTAGRIRLARGDVDAADSLFREGLASRADDADYWTILWHVEGLASVALARGQLRRSAQLFGAASATREAVGIALEAAERPRRDRELAALLAGLGGEAFEASLAEGRSMSHERAVRLALEEATDARA